MAKRKKLLVVIGQLEVGGTERHLSRVLPDIQKNGIDIVLFGFRGGALAEEIKQSGIEVVVPRISSGGWFGLCARAFVLYRLIWRVRPDIVHFFLPEAYVVGGLVTLCGPRSLRIMSRRSLNLYQQKRRLLRKLEMQLHRTLDLALANSVAVEKELITEGIPAHKVRLIYNGIAPRTWQQNKTCDAARGQYHISETDVVILVVANLIPYKGHRDLLNALAGLPSERQWSALLIGRDDGIGEELKALAASNGISKKVRFLGFQSNVEPFISIADIAVLPSHQEGFSNFILESMRGQLPVIATDVGGNSEAIVHNECGLLVNPNDPAALRSAIDLLLVDKNLRDTFGKAAAVLAREKFSHTVSIKKYMNIYEPDSLHS